MADERRSCSICYSDAPENAAILALGRLGNPRYLCPGCDALLDEVTSGTSYDSIKEAFDKLSDKIAGADSEDEVVKEALETIFAEAKDRAEAIRLGTYDFALDEHESEEVGAETDSEGLEFGLPDEEEELTPEELAERERKEKIAKRIDTVTTWICGAIFAATVIGFIWYLFF